ncbi:MAG: site-2 protease family protein, partial [archaeon]
MLETLAWIIGIVLVFAGVTHLIKKHVKDAQTWFVMSMVRFTKPLKIFDLFKNHPRLLNALTDIGLVLGFGSIAVDYLWLQKRPLPQRILGFAASMTILGGLTGIVFPTENPIIPIPLILMQFFFGLFGLAGIILVSLFFSGLDIWNKLSIGKNACAGVAPVIPGVDLPNSPISVPLHAWLSFVIILIVHEASHGFVIRKLGITLKSYGLLLLGFLPIGAFVEPEEKELQALEKRKPKEALRMYAAGPASNFYFFVVGGILFTIIGALFVGPLIMPHLNAVHAQSVNGVSILSVQETIDICGTEFHAPAFGVLEAEDQILEVDGNTITTLASYVENISGKESYTLLVERDNTTFTETFYPNELGRIGINVNEI